MRHPGFGMNNSELSWFLCWDITETRGDLEMLKSENECLELRKRGGIREKNLGDIWERDVAKLWPSTLWLQVSSGEGGQIARSSRPPIQEGRQRQEGIGQEFVPVVAGKGSNVRKEGFKP